MRARWSFLEELEVRHAFDVERLVVYSLKLRLLERRALLDPDGGRERFVSVFDALKGSILKTEVQEGLDDPKVLADAVTALLEAWGESRVGDVEIEVPESVVKDVQSSVMERLKGKLKEGVEITPSPRVNRGFRVSEKEGSAYFDFTDEGITEFLMEYLNPRVAELLKGNAS